VDHAAEMRKVERRKKKEILTWAHHIALEQRQLRPVNARQQSRRRLSR
jgi:hypothetical protein